MRCELKKRSNGQTEHLPVRGRPDSPVRRVLLGAHMSIAGGANMAIERARSINCTAMQMFVKNNMQWFARPLARDEIARFFEHRQTGESLSIFAHANYLINLAATNGQFHANSIRSLSEELLRAHQLDLPFLVLHPGAHLGAGEDAGLEKIVKSIDRVFCGLPQVKTRIALETTAGQGSCLGNKFEHLAYIIGCVREPERLCVCLDTAHIFAAGYDISSDTAVRKTFHQFDGVIGLDRLVAIHLNDSKMAAGSRVDRHEHIGRGKIGLPAFRFIMRDRRFRNIPKVLETPKGKDLKEDVVNLKTLRRLITASAKPKISFYEKSRTRDLQDVLQTNRKRVRNLG